MSAEELLAKLRERYPHDPDAGNLRDHRQAFDQIRSERVDGAEDEPLNYRERVVAYLDVLGTKERIKTSFHSAAPQFGTIHGFLAELGRRSKKGQTTVLATGFSDHVALSAPADKRGIREVLVAAHNLYGRLVHNNARLLRGGVVIGELFHESGIIFGPALIEAWLLELESRYPPHRRDL